MQGNILGQTGSNTGLNIFAQPSEPAKKEGLWVKTTEKCNYKKVLLVEDFELILDKYTSIKKLPQDYNGLNLSTIGIDIFLFSGSTSYPNNYKYNILEDDYTQLANIPSNSNYRSAVAVENDIYLLSGSNYDYKYNTADNTYTQLHKPPETTGNAVASIDKNIYLFGGLNSSSNKAYKYDIETNQYTQLANVPYEFYNGSVISLKSSVYILGGVSISGGNPYKYNYKYNVLTDDYERLADIPYGFTKGAVAAIGSNIYILGGGTSNNATTTGNTYDHNYKYNTIDNTYKKMTSMPYERYNYPAIGVGADIYLFGTSANDSSNELVSNKYTDMDMQNKSIIIKIKPYSFRLLLNEIFELYFSEAKIYDDNAIQVYPTYYGDGTKWIEIN